MSSRLTPDELGTLYYMAGIWASYRKNGYWDYLGPHETCNIPSRLSEFGLVSGDTSELTVKGFLTALTSALNEGAKFRPAELVRLLKDLTDLHTSEQLTDPTYPCLHP